MKDNKNKSQEELNVGRKGEGKTLFLMFLAIIIIFFIGILAGGLVSLTSKPEKNNDAVNNIATTKNEVVNDTKSNETQSNDAQSNDTNNLVNSNLQDNQYGESTNSKPMPQGIVIYAGKQVRENVENTFGYTYEDLINEEYIKNAKEQLNKVLNKYPVGFWNEFLFGENSDRKAIVFCLVGPLSKDNNTPSGFTSYDDNSYYVFVNVSHAGPDGANFEGIFFHELMHVIDFYLSEHGEFYDNWDRYLPKDFCYTGYGANHPESEFAMCMTHTEINDNVWFDSIYSTETAMEDRADIMNGLYINGLSYYKKYPHLYARMKYLKEVLASHFNSIKNCGYDWLE